MYYEKYFMEKVGYHGNFTICLILCFDVHTVCDYAGCLKRVNYFKNKIVPKVLRISMFLFSKNGFILESFNITINVKRHKKKKKPTYFAP